MYSTNKCCEGALIQRSRMHLGGEAESDESWPCGSHFILHRAMKKFRVD